MRKAIIILIALLPFSPAFGEVSLPETVIRIEEEAFAGDVSILSIDLSDQVEEIGSRAFADTVLQEITIPASVVDISHDAFQGISSPLLIATEHGAEAALFALRNNLDFRADTVKRALIIGQTDYPSGYKLYGPAKDIEKIQSVLDDYAVTVKTNLTADEILTVVSTTFANAKNEDISLFYYCGHGNENDGSLVGIDLESFVTASALRSAMDAIPGRKIIIIDACYSGALIGRSLKATAATSDPAMLFISAFTMRKRSLTLAGQEYFVVASSKGDEESWEAISGGVFTDAFVKSKDNGDSNSDGVVSFEEAYEYSKMLVQEVVGESEKVQTVQAYPDECYWFGMFR